MTKTNTTHLDTGDANDRMHMPRLAERCNRPRSTVVPSATKDRNPIRVLLLILHVALMSIPVTCLAAVDAQAGPYRISMSSQPAVIAVGNAKLELKITDEKSRPIDDLEVHAIARMPGMFMGEREQRAVAVAGKPGTYVVQAAFPMAGAYEVAVRIAGAPGNASTVIRVKTGQDTGRSAAGGFSVLSLIPWALLVALLAFVYARMRATGQAVHWKAVFNRTTLSGVLLLCALLAIAVYAVNNWRRQGAMTPIEAQAMEMNTPAPPGTTAVELAPVTVGALTETVRYSGQAVGFVEQDVNPRVAGVITSMVVYVGDRVTKGQVLAKLDTSQLDPQLAEQAAMTSMAAESVGVAAAEYQAALQEVAEAQAEVSVRLGSVAEAESMLEAARQDSAAMEAEARAMQGEVANAQAEVVAAESEAKFRTDELSRMRQLFAQKAISRSELQEAESEAADAVARLRQAQASVQRSEAKLTAARANVGRAGALVVAAQRRVSQSKAEVQAARAAVVSKQRAAEAAKRGISRERAGVSQARAGYESAAAQRGYATLRAEIDGVITQRLISPGTLVSPGQTILKIAQISPIRLQASVAASDLKRIAVGSGVTIEEQGGESSIRTTVSSIQPSLDPQSRTGIVEVLWPNSDGAFRPGQFIEMGIEVAKIRHALTVPIEALQHGPGATGSTGEYVWVADAGSEAGRYAARRVNVKVAASDGKRIAITGQISEGQQVIIRGGTNLREGTELSAHVANTAASGPTIEVFSSTYKPESITVEVGKPITITFIRRTEEGCGNEVMFPSLGIRKELPLNRPVKVTFTPEKTGELRFTCGMDMFEGKVIVR